METEALKLDDVRKTYGSGPTAVTALDGVTLSLAAGTFTAVMGQSGSGKSTLLQVSAGLDRPTSGRVTVDGVELAGRSETELTRLRREKVGFVFQQFNLLPTLTALQNVLLPFRLLGRRPDNAAAASVLERVGLGDRLHHRPAELSGGQQQRVAIARALVTKPGVLFADEPTGALDTRGARDVLRLLSEVVTEYRQTVVMVTHDPIAASYADSVLFLADGRIVGRLPDPTADAVAERMAHLGRVSEEV
ncbi:ABC transporter ATP-binding protein [Spirillospora albida]|uniref:ABC transporter ATP-binding protein n=1 Tax=Spirillospora albida TaxID=58123 RepID=UPI0004C05259|nr:ABC transporter ATP-binding protein [Spirillospora albida]